MTNNTIPVYHIKAGHGRFSSGRDKDGSYVLFVVCSEIEAEPGSDGNDRDHDKETPVMGIRLTHPGSARAWSSAFAQLAEQMEKDAKEATAP